MSRTSGQGQIKGDSVAGAKGLEVGKQKVHVGEALLHGRVCRQILVLLQLLEEVPLALEHHVLPCQTVSQSQARPGPELRTNLVGDFGSKALLFNHLLPDISPGHLVKLVDGRGSGTNEVLRHTANLEETVKDLPRVELDGVLPL